MNLYWTVFIVGLLLAFAVGETYALMSGRTTLSRYVWNGTKAWPPLPFIVGLVVCFVASHFWWGGALICY